MKSAKKHFGLSMFCFDQLTSRNIQKPRDAEISNSLNNNGYYSYYRNDNFNKYIIIYACPVFFWDTLYTSIYVGREF